MTRRSGIARGFGRAAWLGAAAVTALTGCGPQLQTQIVGRSTAFAGPPNPSAPAVAAEIPVPESHSAQVLRYVVALPRAVQLHYQVACPTALREGTLGETFDAYRTRRLADLERERQAQARLIGSLVGAVAPPVRAQASASASAAGPGGSATVAGEIDPGAAAAEAARQSLPPPRLPPGDTGAAVVRGTVDLGASQAGRCLLTLTTDPAAQDASGAQLFLELVRMVDVEAEDRARQTAFRAEQDRRAIALRVWLVGSLQRAGADPMARARARAAAQARAEDEARRRQAAADEETRRRQAAADDANRRQHDAQARADQERWRQDQARLAKENEARAKTDQATAARQAQEGRVRQAAFAVRWELLARLQRLGADPMARERARAAALARAQEDARRKQMTADDEIRRRQAAETLAAQERARREQGRLARERAEAAERERREAPERERRATAERERLAREEAERQARESAEMKRVVAEADARASAEREAGDRRARAWRARQAAVALRWELLARLQRLGADPLSRQHLEEARVAARLDEQRRQYEARARRELNAVVARRAAVDLRFGLVARLQAMGADPDFRRKRDEAMFREMDAQARHLESARAEAAERVRWETQAAIDLRVMAKLRLRQQGAVDRPTCPPPPAETPPPAPFAGATWIQGRYDWTGIAWVWASGHYERPPELGTVWVPPAQIAVSGTLVVRPGRWVRVTVAPPR